MSRLDVEQQLRLRREHEKNQQASPARRVGGERFLTRDNFALVAQPAAAVFGCAVLFSTVLLILTLTRSLLRGRFETGLRRARADVFASWFTSPAYALYMAAWLILVAIDAASRMMEAVSMADDSVRTGPPLRILNPGVLSAQLGLFALEYLGVTGLWLYVLDRSAYTMEMGIVAALLVFFPSFYRSLALDTKAPERVAVWTTHGVFLASIFALYATAAPWLRREFSIIMEELQTHTYRALYRDRPQLNHPLAHAGAKRKNN